MSESLPAQLRDARERTLTLIEGLDDRQMMGPRMDIVNPLRWEIGHAAYFYEYWVLRQHLGEPSILPDADALFDSINIGHDTRWDLPLPDLPATLEYMREVQTRIARHLAEDAADPQRDYLTQYAVFHEDMHTEAFTYTRQTLGYPPPAFGARAQATGEQGGLPGDVQIPGGEFSLGASPQDGFVFDNEKWGHVCEVEPFQIARAAVSNSDFAAFVDAGGYLDRTFWNAAGWDWRRSQGLE
ncbi:MAG: DinB family protein, partial [Sedimenticolaceae bacterium]